MLASMIISSTFLRSYVYSEGLCICKCSKPSTVIVIFLSIRSWCIERKHSKNFPVSCKNLHSWECDRTRDRSNWFNQGPDAPKYWVRGKLLSSWRDKVENLVHWLWKRKSRLPITVIGLSKSLKLNYVISLKI